MSRTHLQRLEQKLHAAEQALAAAVAKEFPEGTAVVVNESGRRMLGVVDADPWKGYVAVRAINGKQKLHRKHFANVEKRSP